MSNDCSKYKAPVARLSPPEQIEVLDHEAEAQHAQPSDAFSVSSERPTDTLPVFELVGSGAESTLQITFGLLSLSNIENQGRWDVPLFDLLGHSQERLFDTCGCFCRGFQ